MVVLYLAMQLVDWLRIVFSGLTSLLIGLGIAGVIVSLFNEGDPPFIELLRDLSRYLVDAPGIAVAGLAAFVLVVYASSVAVVRAARVGKHVGIPEIWQWHRYLSVPTVGQRKPFPSPMAAQVWLHMRRSYFLLPIVTVVVTMGLMGAIWIYRSDQSFSNIRLGFAFVPFIGLLVGAGAHGIKMGILPFRRTKGLPGYTYLQPVTSSQIASARMMANALLLLPTLTFVMILHFTLPGTTFLLEIIPQALHVGVTSLREVAWTLLSRGVLIGLASWVLLAISTRMFIPIIVVSASLLPVLWGLDVRGDEISHFGLGTREDMLYIFLLCESIFLIAMCASSFIRARKMGLISSRVVALWAGIWALLSWVLLGFFIASIPGPIPPLSWYVPGVYTCMGLGALAPLPFFATLFDVHKKRHSALPKQAPRSVSVLPTWKAMTTREKRGAVVGIGIVAFALWLGFPHRPAYEALWRSHGYPVTLEELDAWYPAVPDKENVALKYLAVQRIRAKKASAFHNVLVERRRRILDTADGLTSAVIQAYEDYGPYAKILVVGGGNVPRGEPIPDDVREATNEYWEEVTRYAAPTLKELAARDQHLSRYPIDLTDGFNMEIPHLAALRGLARELSVDSLHWIMEDEPSRAVDSVLAMLALTDSMKNEPMLLSALVRNAIMGMTWGTLQRLLNLTELSEPDLLRLQRAFDSQFDDTETYQLLERPIVGESAMTLSIVGNYPQLGATDNELYSAMVPLRQLVVSSAAEHMVTGLDYERNLSGERKPWSEMLRIEEEQEDTYELYTYAPMSFIVSSSLLRTRESESRIRTQFDIAVTALAVERYRLAHGVLPESLDDLVPDYLDRVPEDYFAGPGQPIRYRIKDNGEYVVYSIGRDQEDDHGEEIKKYWYTEGDLTFTVAPHK
jgi:hypothetical protein